MKNTKYVVTSETLDTITKMISYYDSISKMTGDEKSKGQAAALWTVREMIRNPICADSMKRIFRP